MTPALLTPSAYILTVLLVGPAAACFSFKSPHESPVLTRVTEPVDHGEGPHWDPTEQVLYYVDISGQALHRYDPATKTDTSLKLDKPVALVVPVKDERNKFVVGLGRDLVVLTWDWNSGKHQISTLASVDQHETGNRFNDGKADAKGRVWAGTMGPEKPVGNVLPDRGTLYRLDNDPSKPCVADVEIRPATISNGLTWSLDNKILYYIDTPLRRVDAFDFDLENGQISKRRTVFEFGELPGNPDGMTIDSEGNLWIACWDGYQVIKVDPVSGELLQEVKLPASRVSSVSWGGPALDTLYVTTMRLGLTPEELKTQPHAGAVWQITNLHTRGTLQHNAVIGCNQS
ncbi:regucalcin-like [Macrosteles quadrilineatus]|uniref:regucalcin-like n=1 Tax=Macrosteles quadrilineatus TaxID=74068 RepID=UPI0023E2E8FF|nr:regucalcin-like [Macrosteles quadrilineatus]